MVSRVPSICRSTPVSTGDASSELAAMTVCVIALCSVGRVDLDDRVGVARRQRRELDSVDPVQVGPVHTAGELEHLRCRIQLHRAGRIAERRDELAEQAGGHGGSAFLENGCRDR